MANLQDAIRKLKIASGILTGVAQLKRYKSYSKIRHRDSVREAWEAVGDAFRAVLGITRKE